VTDSSTQTRWRRPRTWILLLAGVAALWFVGSLVLLGWHAKQANSALQAMTDQIAAGDPQAAAASIESARGDTAAVQDALDASAISALKVVPYWAKAPFDSSSTNARAALSSVDIFGGAG